MLIHNTTFSIEESVLRDCIFELKSEYIPDLKATERFGDIVFSEVLTHNEPNMRTYSLQVFCSNLDDLKFLRHSFQMKLDAIIRGYLGKVLFFQSHMRVID